MSVDQLYADFRVVREESIRCEHCNDDLEGLVAELRRQIHEEVAEIEARADAGKSLPADPGRMVELCDMLSEATI